MTTTRSLVAACLSIILAGACGGSSNGTSTGPGAVCTGAATACGGKACDPNLGCVDCTADAQCGGGKNFCVLGKCQECRSNADCGAAAPACWPEDHKCHASCTAAGAAPCAKEQPFCDAGTGACLACRSNADCASSKPFCSAAVAECVECVSNADCAASAPRCTAAGKCAQCFTSADCGGTTPICDEDLKCKPACSADKDCANAPGKKCDGGLCK